MSFHSPIPAPCKDNLSAVACPQRRVLCNLPDRIGLLENEIAVIQSYLGASLKELLGCPEEATSEVSPEKENDQK